jgi:hypothetical protein
MAQHESPLHAALTDPQTAKVATAWGGYSVSQLLSFFGFHSWGDFAAFLAAVYSLILIGEWCWKKWKAREGS